MAPERCRHNRVWIYAANPDGTKIIWCYECGAIHDGKEDGWVVPVGKGGENPYMKENS